MMLIARVRVNRYDVSTSDDNDITHVNYTSNCQWCRKLLEVLDHLTEVISIVKLNSHKGNLQFKGAMTSPTYRTQEIFGGRNFWQTIQVKAIGEEKFGK